MRSLVASIDYQMALTTLKIYNLDDDLVDQGFNDLVSKNTSTIGVKFISDNDIPKDLWFQKLSSKFSKDTRHIDLNNSLHLKDWWEISNQPDKDSSYAYSTTQQPFHTDNAWFPDPAEVNFFYMQKQVSLGGEQVFYPLYRLLNDLEKIDPSLLKDLTNTPVTIKKSSEYTHVTPIIKTDDDGLIFWNYYRTDKSDPFVAKLCDSFFEYLQHMWLSKSVIVMKLASGDSAAFGDGKTLHGRNSFSAKNPYDRVLFQSMWRAPN